MSIKPTIEPSTTTAIIETNTRVCDSHFLLTADIPLEVKTPKPGQFYMIGLEAGDNPLLRRPFSVYDYEVFPELTQRIYFLYKTVGRGTEILSRKSKGDELSLLGPLGVEVELRYENPLMIAGGTGIATLNFLINEYLKKEINIKLLYGVNTKSELVNLNYSNEVDIQHSTLDGSVGYGGTVVELFADLMNEMRFDSIYSCGPIAMLKSLCDIASNDIPLYTSLETIMGCGVGACYGCAVPSTKGGYIHICKDGPMIKAGEVNWAKID